MLEYLRKNRILVVVAHPDDEVLGVGGTINRLVNSYNSIVKVVILGEGITSRSNDRDLKKDSIKLDKHKRDILRAKKNLNYQYLETYNLPDNRFDTIPLLDIVKIIEKEKEKFKPEIIFTHFGGDLNIDHQITYKSVLTSTRPVNTENVKLLISFETLSSTEWTFSSGAMTFKPNLFISLSEENIVSKVNAMEAYSFEKRVNPHPRSPIVIKSNGERTKGSWV